MNAPDSFFLPDVQSSEDLRRLPIQKVGIKGLRYPLQLKGADGRPVHTVANVTMAVALSADVKGTHMSRFIELLESRSGVLSQGKLQSLSKISPWNGRAVQGYPLHTLLRGRFVMRDGKLVTDAAGWGRNVKTVQKMPTPKPRNTELYSSAIVKAPL